MNPYSGMDFFEFIALFINRLFLDSPLAQDELQIYTLSCIAISSALVGSFLVLRKMCMLANSLSHTILTGIVVAFLVHRFFGYFPKEIEFSSLLPSEAILFLASLLMAFLTAFCTELLVSSLNVKDDAATGIVFSFLFSIGILLVTLISKNAHIGAELVMGNADALTSADLSMSVQVAICNVIITCIFFRPLLTTTFDPIFSSVIGLKLSLYRYLLMAQLAVTATAAFRAVGVLMVISFLVVPPLIARRWTSRLSRLLLLSCSLGVFASFLAVAVSRHILSTAGVALSTAGIAVVILALFFVLSLLFPKVALYKRLLEKRKAVQ